MFLTDIDDDGLKKTVNVISDSGGKVCQVRAFDVGDHQVMLAITRLMDKSLRRDV
ncbi:MAG: hypothetical protein MZV70_04680 [Desulfobacterales bacterium]|nr:hypothetical protein [Desulfobacterales bacterium]